MATINKRMIPIDTGITLATTVTGVTTYYAILALQSGNVIDKLTSADQWLGGVTVGAIVFFVLRWAFKRNDKLTTRIDTLHDQIIEQKDLIIRQKEEHHQEIKRILMGTDKERP